MPRADSYPRKFHGASLASDFRGEPSEAKGGQAKSCQCETPWIERDPDYPVAHCIQCGRDYRP